MTNVTIGLVSEDTLRNFSTTMLAYQERRNSSGDLGACNLAKGEQGKASNTFTPAVIQPSDVDVACDVEIAARSVLTPWEHAYFLRYYASGELPACLYENREISVTTKNKEAAAYDYADRFAAHLAQWEPQARELARRKDEKIRLKL